MKAKKNNNNYTRSVIIAAFVVLIALFPLFVENTYYLTVGIFIGIHALIALGLGLLMGYGGQVSMGQAAFFGIGAYVSAILTVTYNVNPWLAILAGAGLNALVALLLGIVVLRLEGHVLAVATLAFSIVIYTVFDQWMSVTGGSDGIGGIPGISVFGWELVNDRHYYYLTWIFFLLVLLFSFNMVKSRNGRALRALHHFFGGSEEAAGSLGISPMKYKLKVFVISAVYAGFAGSIYAHWLSLVTPSPFELLANIIPLIIVVLGGLGSLWGVVIGSAVFTIAGEVFRGLIPLIVPGSSGEYEIIAWGILIILVLQFLPSGLVSVPEKLKQLKGGAGI